MALALPGGDPGRPIGRTGALQQQCSEVLLDHLPRQSGEPRIRRRPEISAPFCVRLPTYAPPKAATTDAVIAGHHLTPAGLRNAVSGHPGGDGGVVAFDPNSQMRGAVVVAESRPDIVRLGLTAAPRDAGGGAAAVLAEVERVTWRPQWRPGGAVAALVHAAGNVSLPQESGRDGSDRMLQWGQWCVDRGQGLFAYEHRRLVVIWLPQRLRERRDQRIITG